MVRFLEITFMQICTIICVCALGVILTELEVTGCKINLHWNFCILYTKSLNFSNQHKIGKS